jgi:hypothetical protein
MVHPLQKFYKQSKNENTCEIEMFVPRNGKSFDAKLNGTSVMNYCFS